ncbi:MAG: KEOPS complex N(6)-L-threonylcarbamoyladenine synthase Kae1 [Candidatus ainarchaeum sp.]|nr:KEOPS complex N(6)-L-threonylcarbamoyladenine synthase Kae1 [Candidatus ainarchaeum sp.]
MRVLGIESSAHTLGVGVFSGGRFLANEKAFYRGGAEGIHPRKAADFMAERARGVLEAALAESGLGIRDFDGIAFTQGPGLGPCLQVGAALAKALAARNGKPLAAVNHCVAHIEAARLLSGARDPVVVYASGGNTQVIVREGGRYRVLGETLDVGIGNMLDAFARELGVPFAHGSTVEKLAEKGEFFGLPYTVKGMDLAFTGLLTAAVKALAERRKEDVCRALQETSFAMLVEATERAVALTGKRRVVACGGVAQNRRLQEMLSLMCAERGARFAAAPAEFNADNGAMVAYAGFLLLKAGRAVPPCSAKPRQRFRVDEVELSWD